MVEKVADVTQAPLGSSPQDAFAIRFSYDEKSDRFVPDFISGVTRDNDPPAQSNDGELQLWDFRQCSEPVIRTWHISGGTLNCEAGKGLIIDPSSGDPQLIADSNAFMLHSGEGEVKYLRLRVSEESSLVSNGSAPVSEWLWKWAGTEFSAERRLTLPIKGDGNPHVYWSFLPGKEATREHLVLRFDPINVRAATQIRWIAADLVK